MPNEAQDIFKSVGELMKENQITRILIIDDAFDEVPQGGWITEAERETFWQEVEDVGDEAIEEVKQLGLRVRDKENEVFEMLWSKRDALVALRDPFQPILVSISKAVSANKGDIQPLLNALQAMGIEPERVGYDRVLNLGEVGETHLVFLDYYLLAKNDSERPSLDAAKAICEWHERQKCRKPIFILMSSQDVSEHIESFRDQSKLLPGLFSFIKKKDMPNSLHFAASLKSFFQAIPHGYKIQGFVDTLDKAMNEVRTEFIKHIRRLSVADYAYLQRLSLQEDGHPLGDYMMEMYGAYLGQLLLAEASVREKQKEVNRVTVDYMPTFEAEPSLQLTKLYHSLLFDTFSEGGQPYKQGNNPDEVALRLGDIFINKDASKVWMVLNAECDLAFAPNNPKRPFPGDTSIILIPGKLKPHDELLSAKEMGRFRTELFEHDSKAYRIFWDTKQCVTYRYDGIREWRDSNEYQWCARMRQPFVLEVQQNFATEITRIGMPVVPPFYRKAKLELHYLQPSGRYRKLWEEATPLALIVVIKGKEQCVLSPQLLPTLVTEISRVKEEVQNLPESPHTDCAKTQLGKLEPLRTKLQPLVQKPLPLAGSPRKAEFLGAIMLRLNGSTPHQGNLLKETDPDPLLLLRLIDLTEENPAP